MHPIDLSIVIFYLASMVLLGLYFWRKNETADDYFVGSRQMGSWHIGLSVVATDVGGGFSIGLGGLGFAMGISGSWLLFSGLIGALLSGAFLIPHVRRNEKLATALTFPDLFRVHYGARAAAIAAVISAIGYLGFTSSQILAGAKLAGAVFPSFDTTYLLIIMGAVAVAYTVLGGLKAVIYTDTIQWAVLLLGLTLVGIPVCLHAVGGITEVQRILTPEMMSLSNIRWQKAVYWTVTIVPIWFVGMTLYQRIYACRDEKTAKRAWLLAGLFEWPLMAFAGVFLGMIARTAAAKGLLSMPMAQIDPEQGLPLMLSELLPVGAMGLLMSAYFSAILSTADSCLIAASGNTLSDLLHRYLVPSANEKQLLKWSQRITLLLGVAAVLIALTMTNVLELMLHSYAFMVSGLFVPVVATILWKQPFESPAIWAMLMGGTVTILLTILNRTNDLELPLSLDPNVFGISASATAFIIVKQFVARRQVQ